VTRTPEVHVPDTNETLVATRTTDCLAEIVRVILDGHPQSRIETLMPSCLDRPSWLAAWTMKTVLGSQWPYAFISRSKLWRSTTSASRFARLSAPDRREAA
jgi:hypothetical protein